MQKTLTRHAASTVFLLGSFFIFSDLIAAQLSDDFSSGLSQWDLFGSPTGEVVSINGHDTAFDNDGDGWCDSGAISKARIDLSGGATITADVYLDVWDTDGCWVEVGFGLTQRELATSGSCAGENYHRVSLVNFGLVGEKCWAAPSEYRKHSYVWSSYSSSQYDFLADTHTNKWSKLRIVIDQNGYSDIYINDVHVERSEEPISNDYLTNPYLLLGYRSSSVGGKAYIDNISVQSSAVSSCSSGIVSSSLYMSLPNLNYNSPTGSIDIWANLEYYGINDKGEHLWKLINYGEK